MTTIKNKKDKQFTIMTTKTQRFKSTDPNRIKGPGKHSGMKPVTVAPFILIINVKLHLAVSENS